LSDDGTGSSNSINDPTFNGDAEPHIYAPEAIPEESSGKSHHLDFLKNSVVPYRYFYLHIVGVQGSIFLH
jgi:hypothetical protein